MAVKIDWVTAFNRKGAFIEIPKGYKFASFLPGRKNELGISLTKIKKVV